MAKQQLIFATNNKHKKEEVSHLLPDFDVLILSEIGILEDIPETGETLEENALIKANFVFEKTGLDCFADDTGLEVEALGGKPGVYSARYAGEPVDSQANIDKLLAELKDCENRNARFRTVIALIQNEEPVFIEGIVDGSIIECRSGVSGFGYDPVFIPDGYAQTFAQMSLEEKNKISHRRKATRKLVEFLNFSKR
jgi:XTP/dITP diphosphohydrolase